MSVVALFVDPKGHYPDSLAVVDWYDESRDARTYDGELPVVAHPPCNLWINYAFLNFKRYGGDHNKPENDGGCFKSALANVRRCGGVLEHPAFSRAWKRFGLARPVGLGWSGSLQDGYVCEVWQSAYGHRARKRTWLYYFGSQPPFALNWSRDPGTHQIGWFDIAKPVLSKREGAQTPVAFANELIRLAAHSRGGVT